MGHENTVTNKYIVISHELGAPPKNIVEIMECLFMDHRCRGEAIKIVVNENSSVGKRGLKTVATPQYIVDQGSVDI